MPLSCPAVYSGPQPMALSRRCQPALRVRASPPGTRSAAAGLARGRKDDPNLLPAACATVRQVEDEATVPAAALQISSRDRLVAVAPDDGPFHRPFDLVSAR